MALPCECCGVENCTAEFTVHFRERSAEAQKCGQSAFDGSEVVFKKKAVVVNATLATPTDCNGTFTRKLIDATAQVEVTVVRGGEENKATGEITSTKSNSGSCSQAYSGEDPDCPNPGTNCTDNFIDPPDAEDSSLTACPSFTTSRTSTANCEYCTYDTSWWMTGDAIVTTTQTTETIERDNGTQVTTLSEEFTTDELLEVLKARLANAAWGAWTIGDATSHIGVSSLTQSAGASDLEYYIELSAPDFDTCLGTVYWDEVFTPQDGGASTVLATRSLQWDLGGPTCYPGDLADATRTSGTFSLSVPDQLGSIQVTNFRFVCEERA
jgi:hypothetical protein